MSTPPENRLNYRRQPDNPDELTVSPTKLLGDLTGTLAGEIHTQLDNPGPKRGIEEVQVTQNPTRFLAQGFIRRH
jgi:hypothetical protein